MHPTALLLTLLSLIALANAAPKPPTIPKCAWKSLKVHKYNPAGCKSQYVLEGRDFSADYNAEIATLASTSDKAADAKACFEHARSFSRYAAVMEPVVEGKFKCVAKELRELETYSPFQTARPTTFTLPGPGTEGLHYVYDTLGQYQPPGIVQRVAFKTNTVDLKAFKSMECDFLSIYTEESGQTMWCKNFPKAEGKTLVLGQDCNHCRD